MAVAQETRLQSSLKNMDERPPSALARGVQITEFKEARVNPQPIVLEDTDILMEQYLSPTKLQYLTGVDNLDDVKQLEIKVNTTDTSLNNFGMLLPNLRQLKVSNSVVPYIRDLGSSLRGLSVLWASRCGLLELDGISSMSHLKEVYLSYNEICDISPLGMLDQLEILDLEGNNIEEIVQVQYLSICQNLSNLTLDGNPICVAPSPGDESIEYDYRQAVKKAIPHLKTLDEELLIEGVGSFLKHNVFDEDWAYLEELQKDSTLRGSSESLFSDGSSRPDSGSRPATAALKPNAAYRPGSALRPSSGFRPLTTGRRPNTAIGDIRPGTGLRPGTAGRPSTSSKGADETSTEMTDATSDLTLGRVICGNPSKALLSRRRLNPNHKGELEGAESSKFTPQFHHEPEHTYDPLPEESRDREDIVAELKAWREEHEKRMDKIREASAPQVLVVDHDDAVSLSGDSEVESEDEDFQGSFSPLHTEEKKPAETEDTSKMLPSVSSFVPADDIVPLSAMSDPSEFKVRNKKSHSLDSAFKKTDMPGSSSSRHSISSEIDSRRVVGAPLRPVHPQGVRTLNDLRSQSPKPSPLKVNMTGLPPPPTSPAPSVVPKNRFKSEDFGRPVQRESAQPVIRSTSFEKPTPPPLQRPASARAALALPSQARIRRQLPTVPSLPSKPNVPK